MNINSKIYLAGHRGLVGSAIKKNLETKGYTNIITITHKELDLLDQQAVADFFKKEKPEYVILAAAKVGGIIANNTYRGEFIYDNLMIQNNVIHQSYLNAVKKLLFLGSTCIYPKNSPQPMKEEYLLTSELEYTNEPYAIAKIAGIKMCESYNIQYGTNYIAVQPTNLYGPNDNFDLEKSHVLPALIRKIHLGKALENNDWETIRKDLDKLPIEGINGNSTEKEILNILSKYGINKFKTSHPVGEIEDSTMLHVRRTEGVEVEIWGSGKPLREFLWSEDMADACVYLIENVDFKDIINGTRHSDRSDSEVEESLNKEKNFPNDPDHKGSGKILVENCKTTESDKIKTVIPVKTGTEKLKIQNSKLNTEIRNTHINIGTGKEISIKQLAETIKITVGYQGELCFNTNKPDGTMRKLTDPSKLENLGWKYTIELEEGLKRMYGWYLG